MDYVAWEAVPTGNYCTLEYLKNVDDPHELKRGISRAEGFPSEACFRMDPSHPKNIKLADNIYNLDGMLVVSERLKEFVEAKKPKSTECLPVTIYNHKGRVASSSYFVINPFKIQDCIDKEQSRLRWNKIDPDLISSCSKLVVMPDEIDDSFLLFRPKHMPTIVMAREDLAEAISDQGFAGIEFTALSDFEL